MMDELTAFERQIGAELRREIGVVPSFDAMAIARTTATQSPKWRFGPMFGATKFLVAGAIVALFGGFLLTGFLAQQPSDKPLPPAAASASSSPEAEATATPQPTTGVDVEATIRSDVLPGVDLVTEEVEPGVYQVLSDGVRDLTWTFARGEGRAVWALGRSSDVLNGQIVAGLDGSVWLTWPEGLFRLGEDAAHAWYRPKEQAWRVDDTEVGTDGTLWTVRGGRSQQLMSFDGDEWSIRKQGIPNRDVLGVEVQSDGTVWAAWENEPNKKTKVGRLDGESWAVLKGRVPGPGRIEKGQQLAVAADRQDEVWILPTYVPLQRYGGDGWVAVETPVGGEVEMDVGRDGTVWVRLNADCGPGTPGTSWDEETKSGGSCGPYPSSILARLQDGEWTRYDESNGVPMMGDFGPYESFPGLFEVAPDGRLWVNPFDLEPSASLDPPGPLDRGCRGVASFDGIALQRYLANLCIYDLETAPAGDVWVLAGPSEADPAGTADSVHTYVITPEAVAATE